MLQPEDVFFILVDVQGKLAQKMYEKEQLFKNLQILLKGLHELEVPIIWAEQYPEGLGATIPELQEILTAQGNLPTAKRSFSVCGQPDLMNRISSLNRPQAIVAGIEAHICVYQTVCDLLTGGFGVTIIADAISSRFEVNRKVGLKRMQSEGAKISTTEMILFELLRKAEGEKFRVLSRLVR